MVEQHMVHKCCCHFTNKLFSWNNLSVVDPLFTLPVLLFFIIVWFYKKENNLRRKFAVASLFISLLYLGTSTIHKLNSISVFKQNMKEKNLVYSHFSTTPTMFTSWLWNMVAYNDSTMYIAEYSVFQKYDTVDVISIKRNLDLLKPYQNTNTLSTLVWFSEGNYFVVPNTKDTLDLFITKWGRGDFSSNRAV
jgi:inner membrane protein